MAINAQDVARELISYAVVTDKAGLVKLLERNGIQMPTNPSDNEINVALLTASAKSTTFKNELSKYLTEQANKAAKTDLAFVGDDTDFGFTGIDDFAFTGEEQFFNVTSLQPIQLPTQLTKKPTAQKPVVRRPSASERRAARVSETNPQGKTGFGLFLQRIGRGLTSQETVNSGINLGLTAINNRIQGRQNAVQQEAVVLTEKQDQLRQQLPSARRGGLTTTSWIFIGVGVLALGGLVYFLVKKNKQ